MLSAVRRELQDMIFRLCAGGGVVIGLLYALDVRTTAPACDPDAIGRCMRDVLSATLIPMVACIGVGALAGAALGAFLARQLRAGPARPSGLAHPARSAKVPTPTGRWVIARCAARSGPVAPGDPLLHLAARHSVCAGCAGRSGPRRSGYRVRLDAETGLDRWARRWDRLTR